MAVYNELQVGRYVRLFQKLFSIKGRQPAPLQFSGEVSAFLSLFHGVENRYLESWNRFLTVQSIAAGGAGFNSTFRLRNPAGSNVIASIEKLAFSNNVAFQPRIEVRSVNTDLTTLSGGSNARLDSRSNPQSSLIFSNQNNAAFALTVNMWLAIISAATGGYVDAITFEEQEYTLLPGDSLTMTENGANLSLNAVIGWRERTMEESELK